MAAAPILSPSLPRHAAQIELARAFRAAGIDTAALDARILVCEALGIDHAGLIRDGDLTLEGAAVPLAAFARRRLAGEPVSRICGRREFYGLTFRVAPETLDPRADTEILVEVARDLLSDRAAAPLRLLDLGTGTGAILAALLTYLPESVGLGVDRDARTCRIAAANFLALGLAHRAHVVCGAWAAAFGGEFDLIVSNPPYVASGDIAGLALDVRDYDPRLALDGGVDGLVAYRALVPEAHVRLRPNGYLVLEIGLGQGDAVAALMEVEGFVLIGSAPDLGGRTRVIHGRKADL
jgi:release factor glutamine methyltransferase